MVPASSPLCLTLIYIIEYTTEYIIEYIIDLRSNTWSLVTPRTVATMY